MMAETYVDIGRPLETPLEESIGALDEIRRAGKTKFIGVSECSAATLRKANSSKDLDSPELWPQTFGTSLSRAWLTSS